MGTTWHKPESAKQKIKFINIIFIFAVSTFFSTCIVGIARADVELTPPPAVASGTKYVTWTKTYGGEKPNRINSVRQTSDGGFVCAGYTEEIATNGGGDALFLRLDANGGGVWEKAIGGKGMDEARSIIQTPGGDFICAGETDSRGAGGSDVWIAGLDGSGNLQWQDTYGGAGADRAFSIAPTSDGGFAVAGYTDSFGAGGGDMLVLKYDSRRALQWKKTWGGPALDVAESIQQTTDGGYIVAGSTASSGAGADDFCILKLDSNGNQSWVKIYGGPAPDRAHSVKQAPDGGYIIAGETQSKGAGLSDMWIMKLTPEGDMQWETTEGKSGSDRAYSVDLAPRGYVIAGDATASASNSAEAFIVKLLPDGRQAWYKHYRTAGGPGPDTARAIQTTSDNGFIFTGRATLPGPSSRPWIVRLDPKGDCPSCF